MMRIFAIKCSSIVQSHQWFVPLWNNFVVNIENSLTIPSMAVNSFIERLWLFIHSNSNAFSSQMNEWMCWNDQRGNAINFHYVNWYVLELSDTVLSIKRVACCATWETIIKSFSSECYQKKHVWKIVSNL
jgi:hypothetical protein